MDLALPVVAVSQLNRDKGLGRPPVMEHLKESGDLEQDADIVLLLWYKWTEASKSDRMGGMVSQDQTVLIIPKNRLGESDSVKLHYEPSVYRFGEIAGYGQEPA